VPANDERQALIEQFVDFRALGLLIANLDQIADLADLVPVIEQIDGLELPQEGELFGRLWAMDDLDVGEPLDLHHAETRSELRLAQIFYRLAETSDELRAQGDRFVALAEKHLAMEVVDA
jgi:hypothetical protein